MKKPTETQLVRACIDYLTAMKVFCWRANSGAMTAVYQGKQRFIRFSGAKGLSDILAVLPPDGWLCAIECKIGNRKLTDDQVDFANRISDAGGLALTVRDSVDDLIRQIAPLLSPYSLNALIRQKKFPSMKGE